LDSGWLVSVVPLSRRSISMAEPIRCFLQVAFRTYQVPYRLLRELWNIRMLPNLLHPPVRRQNLVVLKLPELRETLAHQVVLMLITVMHLLAERQGL